MRGGAAWGEQISPQEKCQQARDKEEREETKFDDEAPECQFAGLAPAREMCVQTTLAAHRQASRAARRRFGASGREDRRPWSRAARVGRRDKTERGCEGCDSGPGDSCGSVDVGGLSATELPMREAG